MTDQDFIERLHLAVHGIPLAEASAADQDTFTHLVIEEQMNERAHSYEYALGTAERIIGVGAFAHAIPGGAYRHSSKGEQILRRVQGTHGEWEPVPGFGPSKGKPAEVAEGIDDVYAKTVQADVRLEGLLRSGLDHLDDTDDVYALARRIDEAREDDDLLGDPDRLFEMLRLTAGTLRSLTDDRDALMSAREWEDKNEVIRSEEPPTGEEVNALAAALRQGDDIDRDVALRAALWFDAIRNFHVIDLVRVGRGGRRWLELEVDASLARTRAFRLRHLAAEGHTITEADLAWALEGVGALRSNDDAVFTPPCLRERAED